MKHAIGHLGWWVACGVLAWGALEVRAESRVENVRVQQRARSKVVVVWYDLVSDAGGLFDVALAIRGDGVELPLSTVDGDIGEDVKPGRNKRIEWNAGLDWAGQRESNFVATVTATRMDETETRLKGMVRIPGGTNSGTDPDFGTYSLTVKAFFMDKTEVTYALWKRIYDWAVAHGYSFDHVGSGKGENHPVHTINWYDCVKWCNARSEMEGRPPAYTVNGAVLRTGHRIPNVDLDGAGYRLPTSEEWEYAARGGKRGVRFPWGNTISHWKANYSADSSRFFYDTSDGYNHPRYIDRTFPYTSPVGPFAANGYGLYDMAGNVWEWVWSVGASGGGRYVRGGTWFSDASFCRCGFSAWNSIDFAYFDIGFRTVRRR